MKLQVFFQQTVECKVDQRGFSQWGTLICLPYGEHFNSHMGHGLGQIRFVSKP